MATFFRWYFRRSGSLLLCRCISLLAFVRILLDYFFCHPGFFLILLAHIFFFFLSLQKPFYTWHLHACGRLEFQSIHQIDYISLLAYGLLLILDAFEPIWYRTGGHYWGANDGYLWWRFHESPWEGQNSTYYIQRQTEMEHWPVGLLHDTISLRHIDTVNSSCCKSYTIPYQEPRLAGARAQDPWHQFCILLPLMGETALSRWILVVNSHVPQLNDMNMQMTMTSYVIILLCLLRGPPNHWLATWKAKGILPAATRESAFILVILYIFNSRFSCS